MDLWEDRRGATGSTLRVDYSRVKHSLARVGESVPALLQHPNPWWLARTGLSQDAAHALGRRGEEPARPISALGDHSSSALVVEQLEAGSFFRKHGERETATVPFFQAIDDFIEGLHSHFSQDHSSPQQAADFDQQMRALLLHHHQDGILPLQVVGLVIWGTPATGRSENAGHEAQLP